MAKPKTFDNKDVSYNKGKSYNLSKGQLKKAGAAKAAKARTVDISTTKRATSGANKGKTLGPAGKPLTGSVKLPSGVTAVYKDGKRVTTARAKAKPASSAASRSTTARTTTPRRTTTVTTTKPPAKPPQKPPKATTVTRGDGTKTKITTSPYVKSGDRGALAPRPGEYQAGRGQTSSKAAASARAASAAKNSGQVPSSSRSYQNGAAKPKPANNGSPAAKVRDWVGGLSVQGPIDAIKSAAAGSSKKKK